MSNFSNYKPKRFEPKLGEYYWYEEDGEVFCKQFWNDLKDEKNENKCYKTRFAATYVRDTKLAKRELNEMPYVHNSFDF